MLGKQDVTVSEIAGGSLAAVRVFERLGIDYCCGGKRLLSDVCREKGYTSEAVESELEAAMAAASAPAQDWKTATLHELIAHIVSTHHEYLRRELGQLAARLDKVYQVNNEKYGPTLTGLPEVFTGLRSELEMHMRKEEMILFPVISSYESAILDGVPVARAPFGTVANPIGMTEADHNSAGSALAKIREITADYALPEYACITYKSLMAGLQELEEDLHMHIHLENNILFPRAIGLETTPR